MGFLRLLLLGVVCLSAGATARDDVVVLRAVEGRTARLPCGQGKVFLDGSSAYVEWFKNDDESVYRFPMCFRFPNEDQQNSNKILIQDPEDGGGCSDGTSLLLKKIGPSEEGLYRCRIHYEASSMQEYAIKLILIDSPGIPKIFNDIGEEITKNFVGPYCLGATFTLICDVEDGNTEHKAKGNGSETIVYWKRNDMVIERSSSKKENSFRSEVTVRNITRDELNAHYECVAQTADVTEPLVRSVIIKMNLPPLKVEIRLGNDILFEVGSPRLVDCVVIGCFPPAVVTWYLDDQLLVPTSHQEINEGNYTMSTLSISPVTGKLERTLKCRAHNPHLSKHIYQDAMIIHVGFKPVCSGVVSLDSNSKKETLMEDGTPNFSKTLVCQVFSIPEATHFTWNLSNSRTIVTAAMPVEGKPNYYSSYITAPTRSDMEFMSHVSCGASNIFGDQEEPCNYTLPVGGTPVKPTCTVNRDSEENRYVIVKCYTDWNGGKSQIMSLEVINERDIIVSKGTSTSGHFLLKSLPAVPKDWSLRVIASNSMGPSIPRLLYLNTLPAPNKPLNIPTWMVGMIAILASIAIILIVTVIATKIMKCNAARNPDVVPTIDGSFHREPELERQETVFGPNICTIYQHPRCRTERGPAPVIRRVRLGETPPRGYEPDPYPKGLAYYV